MDVWFGAAAPCELSIPIAIIDAHVQWPEIKFALAKNRTKHRLPFSCTVSQNRQPCLPQREFPRRKVSNVTFSNCHLWKLVIDKVEKVLKVNIFSAMMDFLQWIALRWF